jgi:hypothetical protein
MGLAATRLIIARASTFLAASMLASTSSGIAVAQEPANELPQGSIQGSIQGPSSIYGPLIHPSPNVIVRYPARRHSAATVDAMRYWNQLAVDATGLDETPVAPGETRVYGEQLGPTRASRAMAIVHIAVFDAVNAILGGYQSYTGIARATGPASVDAAIATAAHDTMAAMFPSQTPEFDALYAEDLKRIPVVAAPLKDAGVAVGRRAAAAIIALRENDGSAAPNPTLGVDWFTSNEPGFWRQDPIGRSPIALGAYWSEVKPFVMLSASQFRAPPPPPLASKDFAVAYNEVKAIGGDGLVTPTVRTPEQTYIGIYWAYDGTPSLCAPPRLYNEIAAEISKRMSDVEQLARLFALVNVAMADAAISIWDSKYHYDYWRPVTGIREADKGTGPTGDGDDNPLTAGDITFTPLGAPASNLSGPNFTPPFPSYPSGHAGFGGALFGTLRNFYGTDRISFTFTSDEFNGETRGNDGVVRPLEPRSFSSLSEAEEENGQSRIYLGIHWSFDKTQAIKQGESVANFVFMHAFQSVPKRP